MLSLPKSLSQFGRRMLALAGGILLVAARFIERYRVRLSVPVFVALAGKDLLFGTRPHDMADLANPYSVAGVLLVLAGLAMRSWAAGVLHKLGELSTDGPYRLIRNPLYAGSFAVILGFCLLIGAPENLLITSVLMGAVYASQIYIEEGRLLERFGDAWTDYTARTGRFFPRRLTLHLSANWQFSKWRYNREYNALAAALLGLAVLKIWHGLL